MYTHSNVPIHLIVNMMRPGAFQRGSVAAGDTDVTGCKWIVDSERCIADGSFFAGRSALEPVRSALTDFFHCVNHTRSSSDGRCSKGACFSTGNVPCPRFATTAVVTSSRW